jgi:hypothetical protein
MITLWLTTGVIAATSSTPPAPTPGASFGWASSAQRVGDTRWRGVREAREEAHRAALEAFRDIGEVKPARRKQAVQRASKAVEEVAVSLSRAGTAQPPIMLDPAGEGWVRFLRDLDILQARLAGMMDAERIRQSELREVEEAWSIIEADLRRQAAQEEEVMVVLSLAL